MLSRAVVVLILLAGPLLGREPVVVTLSDRSVFPKENVTIGHVASLTGGVTSDRQRMATLDLTDGEPDPIITRKLVIIRLRLAGFSADDFVLNGAERVSLSVARTAISTDRVIAVAKAELARRLSVSVEELKFDPNRPILIPLPEVVDGDDIAISAKPNLEKVDFGRTQMNVTIKVNGQQKLTLPVMLTTNDSPVNETAPSTTQPKPPANSFATDAIMVRSRQPVKLVARSGGMLIMTDGEALQNGKVGQTVRVENTNSKQVVNGTVTGPGEVEVVLRGNNR